MLFGEPLAPTGQAGDSPIEIDAAFYKQRAQTVVAKPGVTCAPVGWPSPPTATLRTLVCLNHPLRTTGSSIGVSVADLNGMVGPHTVEVVEPRHTDPVCKHRE